MRSFYTIYIQVKNDIPRLSKHYFLVRKRALTYASNGALNLKARIEVIHLPSGNSEGVFDFRYVA